MDRMKKLPAPVHMLSLGSILLAAFLTSNAADPKARSFDLTGARSLPFNVQFNPDLSGCAVVGTNGTVQSRDTTTGAILAEITPTPAMLDGNPAPVVLAFIPGPSHIVIGSGTNLTVHDPRTGARIRSLEPAPSPITWIQVSPDGQRAVARPRELPNKGLTFWNLANGQTLKELPTDKPADANNIRMMPSASFPEIPAPEWMESQGHNAFAPVGRRFFTFVESAGVDVWDLDKAQCLGTWFPGPHRRTAPAIAALDDHRLAVVAGRHDLWVINPIARTRTVWIAGSPNPGPTALEIRDLALSGDGRRLALAGMRMSPRAGMMAAAGDKVYDVPLHGEVQLWDVATAKVLTTLRGGPTEKFVKVALDHTGNRVVAVHNGVSIKPKWNGAMQQSAAFKPGEPLRVTLWDLPAGK